MSDEFCGYEDTTTGHPCRHQSGSCPFPSHRGEPIPNGGSSPGRNSKLTLERQEQIATSIESGKSVVSACRMAGIERATFYNWMDRGEGESETIYADFFDRIARARGHGEDYYVGAILNIARENDDVGTLLSMLKQRYPESWGDVKRGEQTGGVVVQLGESEDFEIDPETLELVE